MSTSTHAKSVNLLLKHPIFKFINQNQIERILPFGQFIEFKSKQTILKQGHLGNGLYLILKGCADVHIRLLGKGSIKLAQLRSGDFFGEVNLFEKKPCTATVISHDTVQCFFINKKAYDAFQFGLAEIGHAINQALIEYVILRQRHMSKIMHDQVAKIEQIKRKIYKTQKITKTQKSQPLSKHSKLMLNYLGSLPLFAGLSNEEFKEFLDYFRLKQVNGCTTLIDEGSTGSSAYFIISGSLQVSICSRSKTSKITVLGPDSFIIPISTLSNETEILNYRVTNSVLLLELTAGQLKKLKRENSTLWYVFFHNFCRHIVALQSKLNTQILRLSREKLFSLKLL